MSIPSLLAVPAALVLILASTAGAAQDKQPTSTTAGKPVTTLSKAARNITKQSPLTDVTAKTANRTAEKSTTPSDTHSMPTNERPYEGCQGKDSDA
jgi:hypothetical protein